MQRLNPEVPLQKILTPKRRPLDQLESGAISADDRKVHLAGKQARHGMSDQQIAQRGKAAGAPLSKAVHFLPDNLAATINEERRKNGEEAGRQLAKAIIAAPPRLRHLVPFDHMLSRFGK